MVGRYNGGVPDGDVVTREIPNDQAMQHRAVLWTTFLVLGALLWLSSVGVWSHPAYRLVLMLAIGVWSAEFVRTPKAR
jgi:hypothetical protein